MNKYINRELSWLAFNSRVVEEAEDIGNPLLERLKFVSIVSSNLDEFYMIRVGSLWDQYEAGFEIEDPSGMKPLEQIQVINDNVHGMYTRQYNAYFQLLDTLKDKQVLFYRYRELNEEQKAFAERYYKEMIFPVLTPMVVDQSRPFPLIQNKSLNVGLLLQNRKNKDKYLFANVQTPSVLPRYVEVPSSDGNRCFILLEKIIKEHLAELFDNHKILAYGHYRITRNADLGYDEEEAEDLLATIQETLKMRKWGKVVRLEVQAEVDQRLLRILQERLEVTDQETFRVLHSIDLTFLMKFVREVPLQAEAYEKFTPHQALKYKDSSSFFKKLRKKDLMLHHPYDSFTPVIDMVRFAASDQNVLAIKMTLYRVSGNSPIIEALATAAEKGKQVTVLVELKARFDEESNILWAKKLEKAGAHVIYGLVGLKTHCKLLLVVRKEHETIERYVHMSTGNYNDVTAQLYVDLGLMTNDKQIGEDVSAIFNSLSGYAKVDNLQCMTAAPEGMRKKFYQLIDVEIENARNGEPASMEVKLNSLTDAEIIEKLYEASQAGVKIRLLVRGICGLLPGKEGLSENIEVYSIVGRFLEHSRIFKFGNGGDPLYFLSSADWMRRNLDRRVETLFPVLEKKAKERLERILSLHFADNVKCRVLGEDGIYRRKPQGTERVDSQKLFVEQSI
jgi:polyphosphate kinase